MDPTRPDPARLRPLLDAAAAAARAGDGPAAVRAVLAVVRALGLPLPAAPAASDPAALADLMATCSLRVDGMDGVDEAAAAAPSTAAPPPPSRLAERGAEAAAAAADGARVACPAGGGWVAAARMDAHVRLWCQGRGGG